MNPQNFENSADDNQFASTEGPAGEGPLSEATQKVAAAAAGAREKLSNLSHSVKDAYKHTSERLSTMRDEGLEIVRQNPTSSIAAALVVGTLVGYVLGHSSRRA